ncbi:uncharacterized protein LOC105286542 isoform X2 [Ooceraea biroi]|uniref:uncharacterized protein LOC105286542 isoform X2 n=1 Tax=Ooceraea biroi TaxID=2015173 RepID=UPI000F08DF0B|nr:uncharacterized protein LOC105286542 isoform X2 [Ooceraea biroi]
MDTQFFYIHRLSLAAIGLWPYHRTMLVHLQSSVFSLTLISFIIFQLTTLLTTEWTIDFIVEILSTSLFVLLCAIIYNAFWIKTHVMKRILTKFQYICSDLKDENEIAIIKRYGYSAKCVAIGFTFLYIECGVLLGGAIVMTGYGTYSCGLFNIASYRIEQAMRISSDEVTNRKNKKKIDRNISHAVNIHHTALEFITFYIHNFEGPCFVIIAIIVISLSLNLFGISRAVCFLHRMEDFVIHCIFAVGIVICSFGANYIGQAIIDHYNYIFTTAYEVPWYIASVRVQRLILFLLQKAAKPYSIKLGGLCTLSLENFASLSTASLSYFTVIYSIQK